MRRIAAGPVLWALACLLLSTAPLLAKPTRTLARSSANRWTPVSSSTRTAHQRRRASERSNQRAASRSKPAREPRAAESIHLRADARLQAHARGRRRRSLSNEEELAAHTAITTADKGKFRRLAAPSLAFSAAREDSRGRPAASSASLTAPGNNADVLRTLTAASRLKSVEEEAATPLLLPPLRVASLYDSRGRLVVPQPLYGSHEVLLHQNEMADRDGLTRVRDDADMLQLRRIGQLVPLPESEALTIDYRLPEDRRFSRPWTAAFLSVFARDYYAAFHAPLQVDSAVRTVEVQNHLTRINGNAAPSSGDTASPHLTGQAVDIAKGGLSRMEIAWIRTYLQPLIAQGKIDVEEEFHQACFHISVYRSYLPPDLGVSVTAARQRDSTADGPRY